MEKPIENKENKDDKVSKTITITTDVAIFIEALIKSL